ncbi:MAG: ubiquinone biosynthesis regulatory protein kinase UbiB [Gammaproteobacteria bacterium]
MARITQFFRLVHINFVMARYGLDKWIFATPWLSPLRFLSYLNPWHWVNRLRGRSRGECLRLAFEELGPIFVKFGQILSTRRDLLPDDIADELAKLQDRVPPFSGELARQLIEKIYRQPVTTLFTEFDLVPLASASIAQVHAARLITGQAAIVKILRPGVKKVIRNDVALLYTMTTLIECLWRDSKRFRLKEIVGQFEHTILDELDLMREAANASQLRRNFAHSPLLYIPEVYWDYARVSCVVFERIHGIPISNVDALRRQGVNLKQLAENGVEIFFTQVFRDNFFHADMHPGNIFVSKNNLENPQYIAVDFGIMGTLSPADQRYLAENILAFFKRDYRRVAELHVVSGWVRNDTRVEEFEAAIRAVCEPIFERPLKEISFGQLLLRLFQTARRFHMQVQPQLILLQKTLLNIEGLGRQLYPELDLWLTAKPFMERWLKQQTGLRAFWRKASERAPFWIERLADVPDLVYDVLQQDRWRTALPTQMPVVPSSQPTAGKKQQRGEFFYGMAIALLLSALLNLLFFTGQEIAFKISLISLLVLALLSLVTGLMKK